MFGKLAAVVFAAVTPIAVAEIPTPNPDAPTVQVEAGEGLWQVAARICPGSPAGVTFTALQQMNPWYTVGLKPGTVLWRPACSSSTTTSSTTSTTATTLPTTTTTAAATTTTTVRPTTTTSPTSSSTTAPSTTSTVPPSGGLNCASTPSDCGYPDASNTGPAAGTTFIRVPSERSSGPGWQWSTVYNGILVTAPGTVLNGLDVSGGIVIDVPNVTVSNSRVSTCGDGDVIAVRYKDSDISYRGSNARIVHNTLNGLPAGCTVRGRSGVRDTYGDAPGLYVDGNNITGTGNGISVEYEATVVNNWVHELGHLAGDHHSGISTHGGASNIVWRHNTVLLYGQTFPGGGGLSGALTIYSDFAHAQNVTAEDNLLSGGAYVIYGGDSGGAYTTPSTNIRLVNNRLVCGAWDYGPVATFNPSSPGNAWTGNRCDQTGAIISI